MIQDERQLNGSPTGAPSNGEGAHFSSVEGSPQPLLLDEAQFRALLANLSRQAGNMAELAPQLGISAQFLGDLVAGRKRPGPKILGRLGATERRFYEVEVERE